MYAITQVLQNILHRYLKDPPDELVYRDGQQSIPRQSQPPLNSKISLRPFENLPPSYDPSTWWLDGQSPAHPHFDDSEKIRVHVTAIKSALLQYILQGCKILLEKKDNLSLLASISRCELLWKAAVSVHKYGVLYLAARWECREVLLPAVTTDSQLFTEINTFLSSDNNLNRVINYGVHRLVNSSTFSVDHQTRLIPPTAISAIGVNHVAVRAKDFEGDSVHMLNQCSAIWDLHDFAHLTSASLSPDLYGSKYFTDLIVLPSKLTALIRSPEMRTAEPRPLYSDGVVFSELLTVLFTSEIEAVQKEEKKHTYESLTKTLAEYVAEYLLGQRELQHLTTGHMLKLSSPVRPIELATLVQNKAYELTASEIEQRVFTRGGPAGDSRDELDGMSAVQRIEFLSSSRSWLYFEIRNTIKHRAHKLACQKVAERMLGQENEFSITGTDRILLKATLENIHYQGWESGSVVNLWAMIKDFGAVVTNPS